MTLAYDGDGNRVSETVAGVTTQYLVDTQNPTGYAQVVEELQGGSVVRSYAYGLDRINENQILNNAWTPGFYGYDGHGSVRFLTDSTGAITDTYDYDAFGNLTNSTGSTPNNYLFAGEQFDPALGLYYNRARYLNTTTGRFWSMDTEEGRKDDPVTLHRFLYAADDPIDNADPSGEDFGDFSIATSISNTLDNISVIQQPRSIPFGRGLARDATDLSDLGLQFIAGHEGWSARHYADADENCTIGYGHLLHYGKCTDGDMNNISRDTGLQLLHDDVGKATRASRRT